MAALDVQGVSVAFSGPRVLDDISFSVEAGTVTGLIGPNGAGKTTMFNVVTGLLAPLEGRVVLGDRDITRLAPHRRAHRGLSRTFQRLELFSSLTVRDNIRVAGDIRNHWGVGGRFDAAAEASRLLELLRLEDVADRHVSELPTGRARLVEIGRALMTRPTVLLLDEPASGQSDAETEQLGRLLVQLAADGLAICLVEHDMALVMEVCQHIHVLDYGRMIASGPPSAIRADPAVVEAYLGAEPAA